MSDWVCPNCTFENPSEFVSCASCSVPRGELEVFDPFDDTHYTPASDDDAASIPPPSPPNQTAERAETAKRSRSNNLQDNPNDCPMTSQFKKSIPNTQVIPGHSKGEGLRNGIENSSSLLALSESGGNEKSAFDASLATVRSSRSNNLQGYNPNDHQMTPQFKENMSVIQVIPGNSKGNAGKGWSSSSSTAPREGMRNGIENNPLLVALSKFGGDGKSAFDASLATVRSSRSNNLQGYNPNDHQMTPQFKENMSVIQVIPGNSKGNAGKGWSSSSSTAPREGMRNGIENNPLLVALSKFGGDGKSALDASLAQAQIEWEEHDNEDPRQRDERINQLLMNEDKLAKSAKKPTFFTIPPPANVPSGDMASEVARLDTLGRYKDITSQNWNGPLKLGETIRFLSDADSPTQNAYTIRRTGYTSVGLFYVCSCLTWFMDQKSGGVGFRGRIKSCKHICRLRGESAEFDRCRPDNPMRSMVNNKTFMPSLPHKVTLEYLNQDDKGEFNDWIVSEKFDGIRCYFDGFNFWTKAGMPIFPPEFFMEGLRTSDGTKFTPLDGELFIGRGDFQELVHLVLRSDMPDWWKNVKYIVFDCPEATGGLELRLGVAREKVKEAKCKYVEVVETEKVSDKEHLLSKLDEVDKLGGEGLCFADPYARYKAGRNKSSRKVSERSGRALRKTRAFRFVLYLDHP